MLTQNTPTKIAKITLDNQSHLLLQITLDHQSDMILQITLVYQSDLFLQITLDYQSDLILQITLDYQSDLILQITQDFQSDLIFINYTGLTQAWLYKLQTDRQTDRHNYILLTEKKVITNLFVIEMKEIYVHVYTRLFIC